MPHPLKQVYKHCSVTLLWCIISKLARGHQFTNLRVHNLPSALLSHILLLMGINKTFLFLKVSCLALIALALTISIAYCEEPVKVKEAAAHYSKGNEYLEAANDSNDPASFYSRAIEEFKVSNYLNPDQPYTIYSMGQALKKSGKYSEALPYYEKSLELADTIKSESLGLSLKMQTLNNISECHEKLGNKLGVNKALSRQQELRTTTPKAATSPMPINNYNKAGLISAIQAIYEKIGSKNYSPYLDPLQLHFEVNKLTSLYFSENDYRAGLEEFQKAKSIYPFRNNCSSSSNGCTELWKIYQHYNRWDNLLDELKLFYDPKITSISSGYINTSTPFLSSYIEYLKTTKNKTRSNPREEKLPYRYLIVLDENLLDGTVQLKDGKPETYSSIIRVGRDNHFTSDNTYRFLAKFKIPELPESVSLQEALLYAPFSNPLAEVQCLDILDNSVMKRSNPKQLDPTTAAFSSLTQMPGGLMRGGILDLTGMVRKWLKDPSKNRGLLLKEFDEENIFKRRAYSFNLSKIRLILIVSSPATPVTDTGEVIDCVETWDSNYHLVWQDLAQGEIAHAYKRLETILNAVTNESLKISLNKQMIILHDYLIENDHSL